MKGNLAQLEPRMLAWWAVVWPWVVVPHAAAAWRKYQTEKTGQPIVDADACLIARRTGRHLQVPCSFWRISSPYTWKPRTFAR